MSPTIIPTLELVAARAHQLAAILRHAQGGGVPPMRQRVTDEVEALRILVEQAQSALT